MNTTIISTWNHGYPANQKGWEILSKQGTALDAVEQAVMVAEEDPSVSSVGYGGIPDADGKVTLDACIMDSLGRAGSVCYLQDILHPISVARKVMELTPHVMLAGDGAQQFALKNGFQKTIMLTDYSMGEWKKWKAAQNSQPKTGHDTISSLALDCNSNLSGACTTSGLSFKMPGRVGDSPIIGAGLYVDNEFGAAACTGNGEYVMRNVSSFLVVELMRQGKQPMDACKEAIQRIDYKCHEDIKCKDIQVGIIAVNKKGEIGGFSLKNGFSYALTNGKTNEMRKSQFLLDEEHSYHYL